MARFCAVVFIFLFSFAAFTSSDRLFSNEDRKLVFGLALSALPKGRVTSSCPGKKGHATLDNEQILARHDLASIDRILRSVPSPGVGN
uniref:Neprosin activation peptide domain-containing protein n=1 Tax=Salix viminalis TaxID=40686 RepID=A0A6N2KEF8_SALVM